MNFLRLSFYRAYLRAQVVRTTPTPNLWAAVALLEQEAIPGMAEEIV